MSQVGFNFNTPARLQQAVVSPLAQQSIAGGNAFSTLPASNLNNPQQNQFTLANSVGVQSNPIMQLMNTMMQLMQMMMSLFSGSANNGATVGGGAPGSNGAAVNNNNAAAGGNSVTLNNGVATVNNNPTVSGGYGGYGVPTTPTPSNPTTPLNTSLNVNDLTNYVLGQTQGGTAGVDENISSVFMQPDSRLANAGANEFDAVVAQAYTSQFKGYALGLPVAYTPGGDVSINEVANNLSIGQSTPMTPEAETLSKVAAIYRGEFGGVGRYDNNALKNLLSSWGRDDIANQPGVGHPQGDVQSIGGVVKALNEEPSGDVRQSWLQQIFDFQGGTSTSPSGAVPQAPEYQYAIDMVNSGTYDQLLDNYNNDVKTYGPMPNPTQPPADQPTNPTNPTVPDTGNENPTNPTTPTNPTDPTNPTTPDLGQQVDSEIQNPGVDKNINIRQLNSDQRDAIGVNARDRAVIHMWGRQMNERGMQNGDYYLLNNGGGAGAEEAKLIQEFRAQEMAQFGHINGSALDEAFFEVNDRLHGLDAGTTSTMYAGRELHQSSGIPITLRNDIDANQAQGGLSQFEQATLRLWGHQTIISQDGIDGSVLGYTIGNANALDSNVNSTGNAIDAEARTLLEADLLGDGVRNGDSLRAGFIDVMDKVYGIDGDQNGRIGITEEQITADATAQASQRAANAGVSFNQIVSQAKNGVESAIKEGVGFVKDHPALAVAGGAGLVAATAACPFLGGLAVGGAAVGMANKAFNGQPA